MAILISGNGRSGTTLLFRILGQGVINQYNNPKCIYEPYLWNMPEVEMTADTAKQPFTVDQIGLFNMSVHCNTPLFLEGRHMLHDTWLNHVYGVGSTIPTTAPEGVLVKIIRGTGRIEAALSKIDNLKVVIIVRNVVDTVNSSLGLFSFYGDEFHKSDKGRFVQEVNSRFNAGLDPQNIKNEFDWGVLWWRYFTMESFRVAEKYPRRIFLLPYESFLKNKLSYMKKLFSFFGIETKYLVESLLDKPAGPRTSLTFVSPNDVESLKDNLRWYCNKLIKREINDVPFDALFPSLINKAANRPYQRSILLEKGASNQTATSWRSQAHSLRLKLNIASAECNKLKLKIDRPNPLSMEFVYAKIGRDELLKDNREQTINKRSGHLTSTTIGVVITCYNNETTIGETICSVLAQTRKADVIMVCDDASTDSSRKIIERLARNNSSITPVFRAENVGVAANRDLAIRDISTDFVTTLDGDDVYSPLKLEYEVFAIDNSDAHVAFSNIAMVEASSINLLNTSPYHDNTVKSGLLKITSLSAPVPRDLLFRKSVFERAEGLDVRMSIYEDWALKMRMLVAAGPGGWVHSGIIGTIYDRRNAGLSNREQIIHAHGRLLVLARNRHLFPHHVNSLWAAIKTLTMHLDGNLKEAFGDSYTEHVKITLKNSDNLRTSAVYPHESSQDTAIGTLIQGYAMLNILIL